MTPVVALLIFALSPSAIAAEPLWVGRFPAQGAIPSPWQVESLNKDIRPTRYGLRLWDGVAAVEAQAEKSMALLARPLEVDLQRTPILCWRWRVEAPLKTAAIDDQGGRRLRGAGLSDLRGATRDPRGGRAPGTEARPLTARAARCPTRR